MANMGYCRFQNTLKDLRDCVDHLEGDLSEEEQTAKEKLILICVDIALDFGQDVGCEVVASDND